MAWTFIGVDPPELICKFRPTCVFCKAKMVAKNSTMYKVQMTGQDAPDPQGRALDIMMICPDCGYVEGFGVALSQDEAARIYNG